MRTTPDNLRNGYYNPPPKRSLRPAQLVRYFNGEVKKVTLREIQQMEKSVAVIATFRNKTFLQTAPHFWEQVTRSQLKYMPEALQRKAVECFVKTF